MIEGTEDRTFSEVAGGSGQATGTPDRYVDEVNGGGNGHPVTSVFGRAGAVVAMLADYDAFFTTPAEAAAAAPVQSFNGRVGAVVPAQADYDGFFLTPAEGNAAYLAKPAMTDGSVLFASGGQVAEDPANLFWDATLTRLGIGTNTPLDLLHLVQDTNYDVLFDAYSLVPGNVNLRARRAGGTAAVPSDVANGDRMLAFIGAGYVSGFKSATEILFEIDGAPGTRPPGRILFFTGTSSVPPAERMRITSVGDVLIGTTTAFDAGVRLQVQGAASERTAIFRANATAPGNIIEAQNSAGTSVGHLTAAGQLVLPTLGTTGGLRIGGDITLYRSSALVLTVGQTLEVLGSFSLSNDTGKFFFGTASDTNLYRAAVNTLQTDDDFRTVLDLVARQGGAARVFIGEIISAGTAGILFGSAGDTNLYRFAANTLKTDDALRVVGTLGVGSTFTVPASTQVAIRTSSATNVGLLVFGEAGQSADLQRWESSAGALLSSVSSLGAFRALAYHDTNNVKVLGAQGAAVADATDAASAITQLNALLARARAHGLIAA